MAQGKYLDGNGLKYLWQNIIKSYIDDVASELNIYTPTTSSIWEVPYVDIDGLYDSKGVHLVCRKNQLVGISVYDEVMGPHRRPVYAPNGVLYVDSSSNFDLTIGGKTFNIAMGEQWIDLDLAGVTDLNTTFQNNHNILSLSLCMDTSQLREIGYTFAGCTNLISLDISQWNISKISSLEREFDSCSSLEYLDLSQWDTTNVTNMDSMFNGCTSLVHLKFPGMGKTKNVTSVNLVNCPIDIDSVNSIFDYNRVEASLGSLTVTLSFTTISSLSSEQINQITAKGYTIT